MLMPNNKVLIGYCHLCTLYYVNSLFKVEELKNAHQFSQDICDEYCSRGELLVVVDNTNVKRWEMGTYFKLAEKYRYTVILAEPKTPWRYNVQELAARNSHGVSIDVLSRRVKDYERVLPRYFGWFLNLADSRDLLTTAS
ncbi:NEDD4-binding protein 2-like 1 [Eurytemora carolleeae]|uniref:NEDD4-binding protein 2-like 1 n=1 Tax=Eurytemora carolleeae TaxID=1294199 RepID=UPI000C780143|nr:NEDD4-binding protein 2-like 1 [Eurytemora carolleeae]|eukprot:XP_023349258.1 NEDD4-binding protein 2-like 1 [Eurytemora affinis]